MGAEDSGIITATIKRFTELSGIGRSKTYEMLDAGLLESIHVGTRRLIVLDSYRRLIERRRDARDIAAALLRGRK
jgi:hypothetical protein